MRELIVAGMIATLLPAPGCSPQRSEDVDPTGDRPQIGYVQGGGELSRTTFATWFGERQGEETTLLLLVLWRGTPGWTEGPALGETRFPPHPDGRGPGYPDRRRFPLSDYSRLGAVELEAAFDPASRTARVAGHELALGKANVVLMDRVDGAEGPQVLRTLRVDPRMRNRKVVVPEGMATACTAMVLTAQDTAGKPVDCSEELTAPAVPDLNELIGRSEELHAYIR